MQTDVTVNILKEDSSSFVKKNISLISKSIVFTTDEMRNMSLPTATFTDGQYYLDIRASGAISFSQSKALKFSSKSFLILIQTDKAIYKPGETIRFRVILI